MTSTYASLTGYTNRFSVQASETIEFKISSDSSFRADIVEIIHGDPNPEGPGLKYEKIPSSIEGDYPALIQETYPGSYAISETLSDLQLPVTIGATIWPTLISRTLDFQTIISQKNKDGQGFLLGVNSDGCIELRLFSLVGKTLQMQEFPTANCVSERCWYDVAAVVFPDRISVWQRPMNAAFGVDDSCCSAHTCSLCVWLGRGPVVIAAEQGARTAMTNFFNGKIELPFIHSHPLDENCQSFSKFLVDDAVHAHAMWDFSIGMDSQIATDISPNNADARIVNMPTRGMVGSTWSGQEMCWRHAPKEYGAIHFHEDDVHDCGWQTTFTLTIPDNMPSGVYGARLQSSRGSDVIPFFVRPKLGMPTSKILYLASTFTYLIYGNHVRHNADNDYMQRVEDWGACATHPDTYFHHYGASTYNRHSDGSGICYASRFRPLLTMRPGFLTFNDSKGSGLRHFPADTHLIDWFKKKHLQVDVITDDDLHEHGLKLLEPYSVVVTGSHPEYHTENTLGALTAYTKAGGRLVYLGGNGFYWKIATSPTLPGVLEIRRGEGGIRAWSSEPGEYYNNLDGSYGGLWRRNGRPPQLLAGVGFSSQGLFEGSHFMRTKESYDDCFSWMFRNISDSKLGDFGLSGGGAAGFELDRADYQLGTPLNATVVAHSVGHKDGTFIAVYEEMLTHLTTETGVRPNDLIRADIVYFATKNGGAVFSVGSITFCGSLSHNNYRNNISQLIFNVLEKFQG